MKTTKLIEIDFDFRQDSKLGDPDIDSLKLYEVHKQLWSKTLPNGQTLNLEIDYVKGGRLLLRNNVCMSLSSDRMCPHFEGKYNNKYDGWLSEEEEEEFKYKVRTIGGHIIFPAHKKNGFTINQARGMNRLIGDRFDLTLECIRRFYCNEESPLSKIFNNYKDFFELFVDFEGYIDFFLLQDFVNSQFQVEFSLPFDNFNTSPLPESIEDYRIYKNHVIHLIACRNKRILESFSKSLRVSEKV